MTPSAEESVQVTPLVKESRLPVKGLAKEPAATECFGVLMIGKTDPVNTPAANRTKSKVAKIPPYKGDSESPVQPL